MLHRRLNEHADYSDSDTSVLWSQVVACLTGSPLKHPFSHFLPSRDSPVQNIKETTSRGQGWAAIHILTSIKVEDDLLLDLRQLRSTP